MSTDEILGFLAALGIFLLVFCFIVLAVVIVQFIANWKLFEKAGQPGWSAIVPVYNTMQIFRIGLGDFKLAWIWVGLYGGQIVLNTLNSLSSVFLSDSDAVAIVSLFTSFAIMGLSLGMAGLAGYACYMFAKSYGKSEAFCILSILFSGITFIIMGFDKSTQYIGPKGIPQNNGYYNNYNKNNIF